MRSTSWGTDPDLRTHGRNIERKYKANLGPRSGVSNIRIFKRLLDTKRTPEDRIVFLVKSVNRTEVGQIVLSKSTCMCIFVSTIQTFSKEALNKILQFMESLEAGMVDELVLMDGNEVKF